MTAPTASPAPVSARPRRCVLLRGAPDDTAGEARALLAALAPPDVLWVGPRDDGGAFSATPPGRVAGLLGRAFLAVILDLHDGVDADLLGQAHGFVWGGGVLVLRLGPEGAAPRAASLAVPPYGVADVGTRFHAHVERALARAPLSPPEPVAPFQPVPVGTTEQAEVVERLARRLSGPEPALAVLIADRGRGKSSALGLALRALRESLPGPVAVAAGEPDAVAEVFRFALGEAAVPDAGPVRFVPAARLAESPDDFAVVLVDEAAQIPVPVLRRIVARYPRASLAFATTTRGYEGTGRGFVLRFLEQLRRDPRPLEELTLTAPIRFPKDDPVERLVFDALLLDAAPPPPPRGLSRATVEAVALDRDALVSDEVALREVFGLLVHAHYRTTPADLHRILDAPNLRLHALRAGGRVVAATLLALEGGLAPQVCDDLFWGRASIRGHALADTLVCHLGHPEAGALSMVRSVRIAVHPDARLRGLGARLVEHVHAAYAPDLFGTLFGGTAGLLRFRRSVGYEVVRVGASRGARTGEPSLTLVRPVSPRAHALVRSLRAELARDLVTHLELLAARGGLWLDDDLAEGLAEGLPPPALLGEAELLAAVASYAFGQRTFESAAVPIAAFVERHRGLLEGLGDLEASLVRERVSRRRPWDEVRQATGLPTARATMRGLRRAVRELALAAGLAPPEP